MCLDDEASGGCVDPGSEDSGRMRRMEQRKSKQDREQKLHPIQCSATALRQLGIDSASTNRQLVKKCAVKGGGLERVKLPRGQVKNLTNRHREAIVAAPLLGSTHLPIADKRLDTK